MPFKSPEQQRYLRGMTRPKAVRVNIEVVYDDGTFDEVALDRPTDLRLTPISGDGFDPFMDFYVTGDLVVP